MLVEAWTLEQRDETDCVVRRVVAGRQTIWQLSKTEKGWKVFHIMFSNGQAQGPCNDGLGECWDWSQHRNGIRLTMNRIDRTLLDYCEGRRG